MARAMRRRSSSPSSTTDDVPEPHRRAVRVGDHQLAEGRDVDRLALGAHVHLALGALDAARPAPRGARAAMARLTSSTVRPRASSRAASYQTRSAALAVAAQHDLARRPAPSGTGAAARCARSRPGRSAARARDRQPQDRLVLGVGLGDDGRVDLAGQAPGGLGHARLHVLQRRVDVAAELELDGDGGLALASRGGDLADRPPPS